MAKIDRYNGNVRAFAADSLGTERTVFGATTQSDTLDGNITLDLLRGWGVVGVNENPTKQDFNGLAFTLGQLIAYLHQRGVPEWNAAQEYYEGSVVTTLAGIYRLKSGGDGSSDPDTDGGINWKQWDNGIPVSSQSVANIDTVSVTGFYITGAGTAGTAPPDGMAGALLHIERGSSNQATQIFDTLRGDGQEQAIYTRTKNNVGDYTAWAALIGGGSGGDGVFDFLAAGDGTANANSIPGEPAHWFEISNNPGDGAAGNQIFRMNSYGDITYGNNMHSCRYFGDVAAPTAIGAGAFIMSWGFRGHDGSGLSQSAGAFQYLTTEAWDASGHGSKFAFEVTPNNSISRERMMEIGQDGVSVGNDPMTVGWNANYEILQMGAKGNGLRSHKNQFEISVDNNAFYDTAYKYGGTGFATTYQQTNEGMHTFRVAPSGSAGSPITFLTALNIDNDGNSALLGNGSTSSYHSIVKPVTSDAGNLVLLIGNGASGLVFQAVSGGGANAANASLRINKDASTNRSINAGGSINASGADYAEYLRKADTCGVIAKGDVLGIDANGQITDRFDLALSFATKSTDPAYVGGDVWGNEQALGLAEPISPDPEDGPEAFTKYESDKAEFVKVMEAERQHWDRVAFSGRVPVNIEGAAPGDYLVPSRTDSGGIAAVSIASPSFEQYMVSVGKVASIQDDGRPVVLVKVA